MVIFQNLAMRFFFFQAVYQVLFIYRYKKVVQSYSN